jgi:hypothetical protein
MATRPTLPYFAPPDVLPAPLPTVEEIHASKKRISAPAEAMVVHVREHFAVKYGKRATLLQEGQNMLFVAQSSSVPVPKVYAIFHDEGTDENFLIQEYIPGDELEGVWPDLGADKKRDIARQLRRHMDELRSIPDHGYYGGLWRQPTLDFHFADGDLMDHPHPDPNISGPQETEEQWTDAMWRCLDARVVQPSARGQLPVQRRLYHRIFRGHKPVFTHANLVGRNVLLRQDGTVVLIDWEHSGWYPSYWEYCCAMLFCKYTDDWAEWVHEMLDEYVPEQGWMACHRLFILFN